MVALTQIMNVRLCFILLLHCTLLNADESNVNVIPPSVDMQSLDSYPYPLLVHPVEDEAACPPGQFSKDGHCMCGVSPNGILVCRGAHSFKLFYYCVTFDEDKNLTELGFSLLSKPNTSKSGDLLYTELPDNIHELTNVACGSLNRSGTLCGRCLPGHYPLAYSYSMACIRCPNVHWNWVRYIMAAYLPLTFFCIIILIFNINTTSSYLFALVYYCQVLSVPAALRAVFGGLGNNSMGYLFSASVSLYAVWNLDFFRPFYSDICLGIGILPTLALDYAIAVYPLLLMIIFYILIILYDQNYRIVVLLQKPLWYFISRFRRNFEARTSIVDAFATFFFLSNIKFLSTTSDLLFATRVYQLYPNHYNSTLRLTYSTDVAYFGKEHLPYAILAIIMLCVFVLLPIAILLLYPLLFFQRFLNFFPCRWYILHTFVDSFHGCYKDGTQPGTRDYRWIAAVFFLFRLNMLWLSFVTDIVANSFITISIFILQTTLIAALQPYKSYVSHYNVINVVFLLFLTFMAISFYGVFFSSLMTPQSVLLFVISCIVCYMIPLMYTIALSCHWIYTHRKFGSSLALHFKAWRSNRRKLTARN